MPNKIGKTLRNARESQNLTLRQVAGSAGMSAAYLSGVERGLRPASEKAVRSLCEVLNLDPSEVLAHAGRLSSEAEKYLDANPQAVLLVEELASFKADWRELRDLRNHVFTRVGKKQGWLPG